MRSPSVCTEYKEGTSVWRTAETPWSTKITPEDTDSENRQKGEKLANYSCIGSRLEGASALSGRHRKSEGKRTKVSIILQRYTKKIEGLSEEISTPEYPDSFFGVYVHLRRRERNETCVYQHLHRSISCRSQIYAIPYSSGLRFYFFLTT